MSDVDSSVYDLTTVDGQQQAISDIIDEQNDQFLNANNLLGYSVVAYTQLTINLIDGSPSAIYTDTYVHGLGYPPQVIAFGLVNGGYNPLQYNEKKGGVFTTDPQANTYQYWTVDNTNLYFNVLAINNGGHFSTLTFTGAFYIFNIPVNI